MGASPRPSVLYRSFQRRLPLIQAGDFFNRHPTHGAESSHGIADREEGIGRDIIRQIEDRPQFFLVQRTDRGERGTEPQGTTGQQHILHGGIDARPGQVL